MTPSDRDGSRIGSRPRRRRGSGSIFRSGDSWIVLIRTRVGRRKRTAPDYPEAKRMLKELLQEYRTELSPSYRPWRAGPERKPIKARVRFAVLERDGFRCRYCGAASPDVRLTVDHAISVLDGGSDDPSNLVTACEDCNLGKGSRSIPVPGGPHVSTP